MGVIMMVRNNISLRVLQVGFRQQRGIPYILISKKAREESGFKEREIIKVMRNGRVSYAVVGKQLKKYVNEHYGCVMDNALNNLVPSLPDDEVHLEQVGEEAYELLNKFPADELKHVKRLVSVQEIALAYVYGYRKKALNKAVSLQCMSVMFSQKVEQALRGIPEFRVKVGQMVERQKGREHSKILCEVRHGERKIRVVFAPRTKRNHIRKSKFEIMDFKTNKSIYCKTLNDALDKVLKIASKVMEE